MRMNWRLWALTALGIVALLCCMSENEDVATFIAVKVAGLVLAAAAYWLYKRWEAAGKIENKELPL